MGNIEYCKAIIVVVDNYPQETIDALTEMIRSAYPDIRTIQIEGKKTSILNICPDFITPDIKREVKDLWNQPTSYRGENGELLTICTTLIYSVVYQLFVNLFYPKNYTFIP